MISVSNSTSASQTNSESETDELRNSSMIKLAQFTRQHTQVSHGLGFNTRCGLFDVGLRKADVLDIECTSCCLPRGTVKTSGFATALFCCALSCLFPCFCPICCATTVHSFSDEFHRRIDEAAEEKEARD